MHTEVFDNIDTLINMAGSPLNIDEINTELIAINNQIKTKQNEIEDLNSIMTDARYFNASNELVDKNIEISLKNKITRLNRKIKEIKTATEEIKQNEKKLHEEITRLKNKLNKNEEYVNTLNKKANATNNNTYYINLLKKEEKNVAELKKVLDKKTKDYNKVLKELELNNQALNELNEKSIQEKNRLNSILDNLKNPNAYIDEDLKRNDNEKLDKLKEELKELEKRRIELLTNANIIGADAKELVANNSTNEALSKIKELVTIVKTRAYMDINSLNILDEELEKKEALRIELSNIIDSKNYEGINSNTLNLRIEYLKNEISSNQKSIENYQNEINLIDDFINNTLGNTITNLEEEILISERTLDEYRTISKDKSKSVKVRANIENAIIKKEKEKKVLDNILSSYKENLLSKIEETNILNDLINRLKKEVDEYNSELTNLEKLTLLDFKTKDLIEEEKDKEELRKINDEIKAIKDRQRFERTPDEIYDQIEMALETIKPKINTRIEKNKSKSLEIDNLFDNEPPKENQNRIKVIEMIPVETKKKECISGGN